jgi:hypothetical protein
MGRRRGLEPLIAGQIGVCEHWRPESANFLNRNGCVQKADPPSLILAPQVAAVTGASIGTMIWAPSPYWTIKT